MERALVHQGANDKERDARVVSQHYLGIFASTRGRIDRCREYCVLKEAFNRKYGEENDNWKLFVPEEERVRRL